MTRTRSMIAAAALALGLASPLAAQDFDPATMTEAQKQAFGQAVRDYLLTNPQVIMEAVAVLEDRQRASAADSDRQLVAAFSDQLLDDGFSWVGGNPEGDITIVEFMDYRCGYCRRAKPEVDALIKQDGNIRLIVKEFPILGEASTISARFAVAAQIVAGDDAYSAVHDALMALGGEPNDAVLRRVARTLRLDADAIFAERDSAEVTRRLGETRLLAQQMSISGTPSFVVGGTMLRGYAPLAAMQDIVAQERAKEG